MSVQKKWFNSGYFIFIQDRKTISIGKIYYFYFVRLDIPLHQPVLWYKDHLYSIENNNVDLKILEPISISLFKDYQKRLTRIYHFFIVFRLFHTRCLPIILRLSAWLVPIKTHQHAAQWEKWMKWIIKAIPRCSPMGLLTKDGFDEQITAEINADWFRFDAVTASSSWLIKRRWWKSQLNRSSIGSYGLIEDIHPSSKTFHLG